MSEIKRVLMERDGMTSSEANSLIQEAREALEEYMENGDHESAEQVCSEFFGLEPDYLFELM